MRLYVLGGKGGIVHPATSIFWPPNATHLHVLAVTGEFRIKFIHKMFASVPMPFFTAQATGLTLQPPPVMIRPLGQEASCGQFAVKVQSVLVADTRSQSNANAFGAMSTLATLPSRMSLLMIWLGAISLVPTLS